MLGLVPGIHSFLPRRKTWMAGTRPATPIGAARVGAISEAHCAAVVDRFKHSTDCGPASKRRNQAIAPYAVLPALGDQLLDPLELIGRRLGDAVDHAQHRLAA